MHDIAFHIGLHKTATTTLQKQFFPLCGELNYITAHGRKAPLFLHHVSRTDMSYFDPDVVRRELAPYLSNDKLNLLSSESFSWISWSSVTAPGTDFRTQTLHNIARAFPLARIVLVIRRQDSMVKSLYRQYIYAGGTRKVERVFGSSSNQLKTIVPRNYFRYRPYISALRRFFPEGVLVLPFERLRHDESGFLGAIADFLDVPCPKVTLNSSNSSKFGEFGLGVTRILNHLFRSTLNPGGIFPGFPVTQQGGRSLITPSRWLHENWPLKGNLSEKSALHRRSLEILEDVKVDNRLLDEDLKLGLGNYGYF